MTLRHQSRRLAQPGCLFPSLTSTSASLPFRCVSQISHRAAPNVPSSKSHKPAPKQQAGGSASSNPVLARYLKNNPDQATGSPQQQQQPQYVRGSLAPDSIFDAPSQGPKRREVGLPGLAKDTKPDTVEEGEEIAPTAPAMPKKPEEAQVIDDRAHIVPTIPGRDRHIMAAILDPNPESRRRWERKKVIQTIKRRGRLGYTHALDRSERQLLAKSENLHASTRKLSKLATQIAGKPIEDAILQMRFSKKKIAQDVKAHLEHARDRAIVEREMGIGKEPPAPVNPRIPIVGNASTDQPLTIILKDGKRKKITDLSKMYIAQAWVGRGPHRWAGVDHRAKGRGYNMTSYRTSLSVLLKEERTRVREFEERERKVARKPVWEQLPNRPVFGQRPYYAW
ncbi:ribosomal protein L22 [Aulographum hederae CBS 113979]|uniref:Ribosomal protein L22 n=1 Tax=Aulographum hederae CBS 113979 TaxID=1176131 RepID=A0A6G1H9U3_9PEZI|nr:ribosomal protein L22 [Aulographum hederae CBS 113979]